MRIKGTLLPIFFSLLISFVPLQSRSYDNIEDWYYLKNDSISGIDLQGTLEFIAQKDLKPVKVVKVAVIDAGFDLGNTNLEPALYKNPGEIENNGKDDDHNGYVDDVYGWNFLGNENGENVVRTGNEAFRQYKTLRPKYKNVDTLSLSKKEKQEYYKYKKLESKLHLSTYIQFSKYQAQQYEAAMYYDSLFSAQLHTNDVKVKDLNRLDLQPKDTSKANQYLQMIAMPLMKEGREGNWKDVVSTVYDQYKLSHDRVASLDDGKDKARLTIGDNPDDFKDMFYGNANVQVDSLHGTLVESLLAGRYVQDLNFVGVCPTAKLVSIRAIPDGDEYDKDIATAIRYAVNSDVDIINMSFGKYLSPHSKEVTKALRYAEKKGILLVKAAGNDGKDIDSVKQYPSAYNKRGKRFQNMLVVGASGKDGKDLKLSCYGEKSVDVFAPGYNIRSIGPKNTAVTASGTSLATPIVSGIAAMIQTYYPDLSAKDVKSIIMKSVDKSSNSKCVSGGVVNLLSAMKTANQLSKFGK